MVASLVSGEMFYKFVGHIYRQSNICLLIFLAHLLLEFCTESDILESGV